MSITTSCKLDLDRDGVFETDISDYMIECSVTQGRKKSLDPMNPARAIIKLNNEDGRFSPRNTGGPYGATFNKANRGIKVEAESGATGRNFAGYIRDIKQDPYHGSQEVVLTCVDRLGLAAEQLLSAGAFRQQPVNLILNRLLDLLEKGEEITNPGGASGSLTGYTATDAGVTLSATDSISFEGDYGIQAICDGSASGQGWRYDLGAAVTTIRRIAVHARTAVGDGNVTLTIRGLNASLAQVWVTTIAVVDSAWTYWREPALLGRNSHRYIEIITGSAVPLTILTDCLHQVPVHNGIYRDISANLDAICELVALYDGRAGEALEKLVATQAGGFLWMGGFLNLYGTVYARCQADRDADSTPDAIFADDGSGVRYVGFRLTGDGDEMISEARVESEGSYSEDNEETTAWELSPAPLVIPASTTVKIKAPYTSPTRGAALSLSTEPAEIYRIGAQADDGYISHYDVDTYPPTPDTTTVVTAETSDAVFVGQRYGGGHYWVYRSYHRFDTSAIPNGDAVGSAKLRLKLKGLNAGQTWTLEVRQPTDNTYDWGTLAAGDWQATPSSDPLIGSLASSLFPPVGQWIEIDLDVAAINKAGSTCFYLISSRDTAGTAPTGENERIQLGAYGNDDDEVAELVIAYPSLAGLTTLFTSYGAGADIEITGGAADVRIESGLITGTPYSQGSERSLVVVEATTPAEVPNPLTVVMPHQGTRTAEMQTEAQRLVDRLDAAGIIDQVEVDYEEQDAATLAQMKARQINDLVTVKNIEFDYSTKINDDFFVEGVNWRIDNQGKVLTVTFDMETK